MIVDICIYCVIILEIFYFKFVFTIICVISTWVLSCVDGMEGVSFELVYSKSLMKISLYTH